MKTKNFTIGLFISFLLTLTLFACTSNSYDNPHVLISTRIGDIEVELFPKQAPKSAGAFLQYVDKGLYNNASFYRVLKTEEMPTDFNTGIIQGGLYGSPTASTAAIAPIPHEPTSLTGLSHTSGAVSFASSGAGTATTEFFICIGDQSPLDAGRNGTPDSLGYAVFGKVVKGMPIVRKIQAKESSGDRFNEKIEIQGMKRL